MSNSWNLTKSAQVGKFALLQTNARTNGWDISDSSVTTSWEEADLTAIIGEDAVAVFAAVGASSSHANDRFILMCSNTAVTQDTNWRNREYHVYYQIGAGTLLMIKDTIIPTPMPTPGKFRYWEFSTSYPVATFYVNVRGRVRP